MEEIREVNPAVGIEIIERPAEAEEQDFWLQVREYTKQLHGGGDWYRSGGYKLTKWSDISWPARQRAIRKITEVLAVVFLSLFVSPFLGLVFVLLLDRRDRMEVT